MDIISGHGILILPKKDIEIVYNAIIYPKGPNEKLRDTAQNYKNLLISDTYEQLN